MAPRSAVAVISMALSNRILSISTVTFEPPPSDGVSGYRSRLSLTAGHRTRGIPPPFLPRPVAQRALIEPRPLYGVQQRRRRDPDAAIGDGPTPRPKPRVDEERPQLLGRPERPVPPVQ